MTTEHGRLLTIKEVAYELDVPRRTAAEWVQSGRLPSCDVGPAPKVRRRVRVPLEAVNRAKQIRGRD